MLLKESGPLGSSLKMLLASSVWKNPLCRLTWKATGVLLKRQFKVKVIFGPCSPERLNSSFAILFRQSKHSDIRSNPLLFQLAVSERPTGDTGSGLLATPNTMDALPAKSQKALDHELTHRQGRAKPNNLRDQIAVESGKVMRGTPTVPNGGRSPKGGMSPTGMTPDGKKRQVDLNHQVKQRGKGLWPTPMSYSHGPDSNPPGITKLDIEVRNMYPKEGTGMFETPTSAGNPPKSQNAKENYSSGLSLTEQARMWPTPDARDANAEGLEAGKRRLKKYSTCGLQTAAKLYPTPSTVDSGSYFNQSDSAGAAKRPTLGAMAKHGLFPTPNTPRPKDNESTAGKFMPSQHQVDLTSAVAMDGGQLNPDWVELLMNFPQGWTNLGVENGNLASPALLQESKTE